MKWLKEIMDWSEVWATLIPLTFFIIRKPAKSWVKPVLIYLIISLVFFLIVDVTFKARTLGLQAWCEKVFSWLYEGPDKSLNNLIFYYLISLTRLLTITWFFSIINKGYNKIHRAVAILFIAFVLINFSFFEKLTDFSSRTLTAEAAIMLFYCLLFIYHVNLDDEIASPGSLPEFWIVCGLTLYAAINFFIFLFFRYLIATAEDDFAKGVWYVHNSSFIILNLFISAGFYRAAKKTPITDDRIPG